jgi:hypothetical protein
MPRKFVSFRSIGAAGKFHLAASFWISALLSICHITDVSAMVPAAPSSIYSASTEIGGRLTPAGYCREGYECGGRDAPPSPQYHARGSEYEEHYDKGWYARPERHERHVETECEEEYEVVEVLPIPEPYHYDPHRGYSCGVRCWYKRLTSGYCGRGCEYYLYRIGRSRGGCIARH